MGNNIIELDPQLLLEQSQQMNSIYGAFESLFSGLLSDLKGLNSSWSDMLSNNFTGKITAAQKSFMGSMGMIKTSSDSTKSVAEAMLGISASAGKYSGKFGDTSASMSDRLMSGLQQELGSVFSGEKMDGLMKDITSVTKPAREYLSGNLTSWQEAMLDEGVKKLYEEKLGDYKIIGKLGEKIVKGDPEEINEVYRQLSETIGTEGAKDIAKVAAEKLGMSETDAGKYVAYAINLTKDVTSSATECYLDPSFESMTKVAWNMTGQPIIDTAGDTIEKVVKLCPGISDYYDANGGNDLGSAAQTALGDFYGMVTGDESMKKYASQYYENNGGAFEGVWNGVKDALDFTKESGGVINAAKKLTETATKDFSGVGENLKDVQSIINKNGGFVSSVAKGLKSLVVDGV
ncbi:MAG: hypothetical protein K5750_09485 [Eubacterium sp.]|nr:hypothetical protein [Eubacterium sp.]